MGNLDRHNKAIHLQVKKYKCEGCSKTFFYKKSFLRHTVNRIPHSDLMPCSVYTSEKDPAQMLQYNIERDEYSCNFCVFTSSNKEESLQHVVENHRVKNSFKCNQCHMKFRVKHALLNHFSEYHTTQEGQSTMEKLKLFKCCKCSSKFQFKTSLQQHQRDVHAKKQKKVCNQCSFTCNKKKQLMAHIITAHNNTGELSKKMDFFLKTQTEWKCDKCNYSSFSSVRNLNRHIKAIHSRQKDFMCDHCSTLFSEKRRLEEHLKANQPDSSDPSNVIHCTKYITIFQNPLDEILHDEEKEEFACMLCDFRSTQKDFTLGHVENMHKLPPIRICSKCKNFSGSREKVKLHWSDCHVNPISLTTNSFNNNEQLKEVSISTISATKENSLVCTHCGDQFFNHIYLKQHIRQNRKLIFGSEYSMTCKKFTVSAPEFSAAITEMQESGLFSCSGCDFVTGDQKLSRLHLRLLHREPSKRFGCKICHEKFPSKAKVVDHLRDAHGENMNLKTDLNKSSMLFCNQCSYKSNQSGNFQRHVSTVHLMEKKFQCGICGNLYTEKRRLLEHCTIKHADIRQAQENH
jgi:KRAB domain-containing zinc finger protein